ncbi:ATP-binding protein [Leadbettera azotonutricia]|uniref:ATPase n=1 Tax=Leadbettera azotonutricia (strain ATCC BAA-888 / DSM 13862 / ZAS-9) TaxID=545695 RepID=F5YAA0_LEAAZ|nr:ATP-binding protein [Leadbettera azotonutricia]AEF83040.1 ATPase [Leadbettera azotonutricia ZAS-9]
MYIYRHAAETLAGLRKHFGAVLVTGPRQVGKTTLLEESVIRKSKGKIGRVTLDDPVSLEAARDDGGRFLLDHKPPVMIDEIQYAPNLFSFIKMAVDTEKKSGLFFMSGSQQFSLMKGVSESLAGRVGIIDILGLSMREISGDPCTEPFCPTADFLKIRGRSIPDFNYDKLWEIIWRGSMPKLYADPSTPIQAYYGTYLRTYIERDVRSIVNIGDERKFLSFIRACAARTGQMLNLVKLAEDVDVSRTTAERWLSILISANLIFLLKPFHVNIGKREIQTPKLYFLDTGLAAYLIGWDTPAVLRNGAMNGAFFETFVIAEIIKSYINKGIQAPVYYYRDKDQREIDLLIWHNGHLYPVEIKMTANPTRARIEAFKVLDGLPSPYERGEGALVCCYDKVVSLGNMDKALPVGWV